MSFFNTDGMGNNMLSGGFQFGSNLLTTLFNYNLGQKAQHEQYNLGERSADNAYRRQLEMYDTRLSPKAQMEQIKAAGLSPSIYASGGIAGKSGASAPQGAGAGINPAIGMNPLDLSAIAVNNAQARKLNAEANTEEKTGVELNSSVIAQNMANAGYQQAAMSYTKVQTKIANIEAWIKDSTKESDIARIAAEAESAQWQSVILAHAAVSAEYQAKFDAATYADRVVQEMHKTDGMELMNIGAQLGLKLTQAEIDQIYKNIAINSYNSKTARLSANAQAKWYKDQIENQLKGLSQDQKQFEENLGKEKTQMYINAGINGFNAISNSVLGYLTFGMYDGVEMVETNETSDKGWKHTTVTKSRK